MGRGKSMKYLNYNNSNFKVSLSHFEVIFGPSNHVRVWSSSSMQLSVQLGGRRPSWKLVESFSAAHRPILLKFWVRGGGLVVSTGKKRAVGGGHYEISSSEHIYTVFQKKHPLILLAISW